ncbi:MAG: HAD family hydrolase [Sphingomonadaceae bacterium]
MTMMKTETSSADAGRGADLAGEGQQFRLVLATDLDGTFLGGTETERRTLYEAISSREDVLLIFVTGRDVDFIRELIAQPGMPRPRYIVGDVGTSVYDVDAGFQPVASLEAEIAALWDDANDRVMEMLAGEPGLQLQPTPFRHRVSYYYKPDELRSETRSKVEAAGFDCLTSADLYFDVLPRGVAKGPTLRRMVDALNLPPDRVLVAGDTMNDLSMFQTGFKGVAVGNSEPRLIEALPDGPHVYRSPHHGAAGVLDAIFHFQLGDAA